MKCAFYVDPYMDFRLPSFRSFPITTVFPLFVELLEKNFSSIETTLIAGYETLYEILSKGMSPGNYDDIITIQAPEVEHRAHEARLQSKTDLRGYDLVIIWESDLRFVLLDEEQPKMCLSPGYFSRSPYPYHITVDYNGFFGDSYLANQKPRSLDRQEKLRALACQEFMTTTSLALRTFL